MKIFTISDIHGSSFYLELALKRFEEERCELLLILGDELYHGPRNPLPKEYDPQKTAELLNRYRDKILAVRGNCDSEVDQMLLEFPIMGDYTTIFWNEKKIFATHGHLNEKFIPKLSPGNIFISGHTHIPVAKKEENGIIFLNPGSISLPKAGFEQSYGIFYDNKYEIKSLETSKTLMELEF